MTENEYVEKTSIMLFFYNITLIHSIFDVRPHYKNTQHALQQA